MSYIKYGTFEFNADSGYPVPQISISVDQDRDGAGRAIGQKTIVNLEGVIYAKSGNRGFDQLVSKESGLRNAFKTDGLTLEIGCSGTTVGSKVPYFSGIPKVNRYTADKTNNYWLNTIAYSIELQIDASGAAGSNIFGVTSTQDEWNIETIDEFSYVNNPAGGAVLRSALNIPIGLSYPLYRISRTIGAVGKFIPTGSGSSGISPIKNAKDWVFYQVTGGLSLSGVIRELQLYNFTRSIATSEVDGTYRITDNWIGIPSGSFSGYTESYNVESSLDNSYLRTVNINGTIKGIIPFNTGALYTTATLSASGSGSLYPLGAGSVRVTSPATSKFESALSGYSGVKGSMLTRAQCFLEKPTTGIIRQFFNRAEAPLNPLPLSVTEGFNPTDGSVTYSWVYNNRPINLVSGSISETFTINDTLPVQQVAEIFVLGRRLGPILQDLGTYSVANRDVTFEVNLLRPSGLSGIQFPADAYRAITGLIESFNPKYLSTGANEVKSFEKSNTENWYVSEGRFVKSKSWSYTRCN